MNYYILFCVMPFKIVQHHIMQHTHYDGTNIIKLTTQMGNHNHNVLANFLLEICTKTKLSSGSYYFKKIYLFWWLQSHAYIQTSNIQITQGRRNRFCLGGAQIIRKMRFCEFSKILLYKSPILGVAQAGYPGSASPVFVDL